MEEYIVIKLKAIYNMYDLQSMLTEIHQIQKDKYSMAHIQTFTTKETLYMEIEGRKLIIKDQGRGLWRIIFYLIDILGTHLVVLKDFFWFCTQQSGWLDAVMGVEPALSHMQGRHLNPSTISPVHGELLFN